MKIPSITTVTTKARTYKIIRKLVKLGLFPQYGTGKSKKVIHENKARKVINHQIVDFIENSDDDEVGFFEMNSGIFFSYTFCAMSGTGSAGIDFYDSYEELPDYDGKRGKRLSEVK